MRFYKLKLSALIAGISLVFGACSKDDDETAAEGAAITGDVSLDTLPDAASMLTADTADGDATAGVPAMGDLDADADAYFYSGAVAAIVAASGATEDQRSDMERGDAVCRLAARTGNTFGGMVGGTLCYMGQLPGLSEGAFSFAKESASVTADDYSGMFSQEATSKTVAIKIMAGEQVGQMAFITVAGTDTSPNAYNVDFHMCQSENGTDFAADNSEVYDINKVTGVYTRVENQDGSEEGQTHKKDSTATAFLTNVGSTFKFDLTKDRTIVGSGSNSWSDDNNGDTTSADLFEITIGGDNVVTSYFNRSRTDDTTSETEKLGSKAVVTGSTIETLGISEMAMTMERSRTQGSDSDEVSGGGAVSWQTDGYKGDEDSDLAEWQADFTFAASGADVFDNTPVAPTVDLSDRSCDEDTADVVVEWDAQAEGSEFSDVEAACEDNTGMRDLWEMCNASNISAAWNLLWQ